MATKANQASKSMASKTAAAKKAAPVTSKPVVTAKNLGSANTSTSTKASMPQKNTPTSKASTAVTLPKAKAATVQTVMPKKSAPAKPAAKVEPDEPVAAPKAAKKSPKSNGDLSENNLPSEAELLRMPEDEYMNDRQLGFFRDRLRQLEQDILNNAGATTEHLRETQFVPDPADRATIEEEHALELRTRDRERKLLKKVQQSIIRIDSGEYGWCDETGEPIGLRRLLARPTATLSLEAQERREMRQKMFGD